MEGYRIGFRQGLRLGRIETLRKLIEHKFGVIPDWADAGINEASAGKHYRWSANLVNAQRVEDVFK